MNYLDCIPAGGIVFIREGLIKAQASGQKVYRFESGDPSFSMHPKIKEAITKAMELNKTHYTAGDGIAELKKAIAERSCKQGTEITSEDVFITNGAMNGLFLTYMCLQDEGMKDIVVPDPMWTEAVENIKLAGIGILPVAFDPHTENYTWSKIEEEVGDYSMGGIFLNSPHNPTGKVLTVKEKQEIVGNAVERDIWIIADEAYETITYYDKHTNTSALIPKGFDKWVSLHSMSKSFAMPGLRLGWIITKNEQLKSRLSKLMRCNINGINSITQWGAVEALSLDRNEPYFQDMNEEYMIRREIMYQGVKNNPVITPILPDGGFFIWCKVNDSYDAAKLSTKLASMGMGNAPGDCFGSAETTVKSIRFSFSVDTAQVIEGSKELNRILNNVDFQNEVMSAPISKRGTNV